MTTTNKSLNTPANNSFVGTWDVPVNANFTAIDSAFGGVTNLSVTSVSGTVNLTLTQYTPPIIIITGTLTASIVYTVPSGVGGYWSLYNHTTGAFTVTFASLGAGSSVALQQGFSTLCVSDGTNIGYANSAPLAAAGSTTQVQYNASGLLAGSANFTWTNGTSTLGIKGILAISGSSSGTITISGLAAAGTYGLVLPNSAGSSGQFLTTDGLGNLSWTGAVGGVTSFSAGTTGLTPSTGTGGAVTLAGTLGTGNGGTGLTGFSSGGAVFASNATTLTTGTLGVSGGGTGSSTTPTNGQVLIGTGAGFSLATITAGAGVAVTNGMGSITITATGSGGTVTSVAASGGTTGLSFTGSPITGTGTLTLGGTLGIANGGTGAGTQSGARTGLGLGTAATQNTGTSGANIPLLNGANSWSAAQAFAAVTTFTAGAETTPSAVTFNATAMVLNCALSNVFTTTFTAPVTVAPTLSNPGDGQTINWFITQDSSGSRTMTWPTSFKWPGGVAGVLSTGANAVDLLVATYRAATSSWYCSLSKAFA